MHPRIRLLFQCAFWIALISSYVLALLPHAMMAPFTTLSDKLLHVLAFVVLTLLLRLAYPISRWVTVGWLLSYGTFIEFSQQFAINRSSDLDDVIADGLGIVISLLMENIYRKLVINAKC